ncbi:DUF4302 domain-containing protein [Aquimarina agarivorans]|uniref:DUF4302 domain-containing protein n=1 Tax=Aquimarina agarivorans TaxID=980584 RepID=UPI000248EFAE|nr:DUF4302 domain-containing protein [Aquimarina agarivorans]
MKKINKYLFALATLFLIACASDNDIEAVFEENTQDRVTNKLKELNTLLLSAEFGWTADYVPSDNSGVYKIHLKFNENNTVNITSDHNSGEFDGLSSYRVGISQVPELVFDTYNTFSNITDDFDGFQSVNFSRDAEFQFNFTDEFSEEEIVLLSKSDLKVIDDNGELIAEKSKLILKRATQTDADDIIKLRGLDKRIANGFETDLFFRSFVVTNTGNETIFNASFSFDPFTRVSTINFLNTTSNVIETVIKPISITENGFKFVTPIDINGTNFESFNYNDGTNTFVANQNNLNAVISHGTNPGVLFFPESNIFGTEFRRYLFFDKSSNNYLTLTSDEFVNLDVDDSFTTLNIFFDTPDGSYFDFALDGTVFARVFFEDVITENEKIKFNLVSSLGDVSTITSTLDILFNTEGFYVERTEESVFTSNPSFLLINISDPSFRFSLYGI